MFIIIEINLILKTKNKNVENQSTKVHRLHDANRQTRIRQGSNSHSQQNNQSGPYDREQTDVIAKDQNRRRRVTPPQELPVKPKSSRHKSAIS